MLLQSTNTMGKKLNSTPEKYFHSLCVCMCVSVLIHSALTFSLAEKTPLSARDNLRILKPNFLCLWIWNMKTKLSLNWEFTVLTKE